MSERDNWNVTMGTQADTYIEKRFEEVCETFSKGFQILNEWRQRKEQYISYTNTIIFDYQHYSRHDITHSLKILESIELIIGKERIDSLSVGDLWLLLETAYFHDIGMAVTYEDLLEIWKSEEFKKFLCSTEVDSDQDLLESKNWYISMDKLVRNYKLLIDIEEEREEAFSDTWPLELERKLLFLVTAFIRKDHAKRCKKYLKRFSKYQSGAVPERLYQIVAEVSVSHGESFDYILKNLKYKTQGMGMDYVHPQFAATMLRLGDLLDMDNNRFNIRALEHYGKIPWTSMLHLRKHKAMTHILITRNRIEAEAEEENLEICQITQNWFRYIEQEVINLICYWSEIAPQKLSGCLMQKAKCKVYHPYKPIEFKADWQKRFEVDKAKLTDLLIGVNIYDIKLEFLREYIQNAMDASKMQLWLDLKQGKHQFRCNPEIRTIQELAPFDIPAEVYDQYTIEVSLDVDIRSQKVKLEVIDQGIGMEEACLDVISKIGMGWKGRQAYSEEIALMPRWLRPTGGFGIGIQSAFMLSDQVELLTKADSEIESHRITLNSPRCQGTITEEKGPALAGNRPGSGQRGTNVRLEVDLEYFQLWAKDNTAGSGANEGKRKNTIQKLLPRQEYVADDIFDADSTLDYVMSCVEGYLKEIIANAFIPIRITNPRRQPVLLQSSYKLPDLYWKNRNLYFEGKETVYNERYRWIYDKYNNAVVVWGKEENVYIYIKPQWYMLERRHTACFKNICVIRDTDFDFPVARDFTVCIDFMGHSAEKALKVHRNAFNENFPLEEYVQTGIGMFLKVMYAAANKAGRTEDLSNQSARQIAATIEDNLNRAYVPLVHMVFFDKNIPFKEPLPQKIVTKVYKIENIIENNEVTNIVSYHKDNSLSMLLNGLRDVINGKEGALVALSCKEDVPSDAPLITRSSLLRMLTVLLRGKKTEYDRAYQQRLSIVEKMKEDAGLPVYCDEYVYSVLRKREELNCDFYRLSAGENEEVCLSVFTRKQGAVHKTTPAQESSFHQNAYGLAGRKVFGLPEAEQYPSLMVSSLPFGETSREEGPYLISPISQNVRDFVIKKTNKKSADRYQKTYSLEEFVRFAMEEDEFQALLEWVYRHQIEKGRYKKEDIWEKYREFLEDIYDNYLSREISFG